MTKSQIPQELKRKMAQSVVGSGPSMVPKPRTPVPLPPPMATVPEEVVPTVDDLIADQEELSTLRQLVSRQLEYNAQKKHLEKALEPINDRIKAIVSQYGIDNAVCDGATINYRQGERKTLNPMRLVANGVAQEVIDQSYDVSITHTLTIRGPK